MSTLNTAIYFLFTVGHSVLARIHTQVQKDIPLELLTTKEFRKTNTYIYRHISITCMFIVLLIVQGRKTKGSGDAQK